MLFIRSCVVGAGADVDVGMPKKGKLNKKDVERQAKEGYKKAKDKHSAIESAINGIQHHGGNVCRDYSKDKYESHAASSVISKNLIRIGDIIIEKENKKQIPLQYNVGDLILLVTPKYEHKEKDDN